MNPWPFILGAYGLTLVATLGLAWSSFRAMRRAETDAEKPAR
jgi:hypothetical protein